MPPTVSVFGLNTGLGIRPGTVGQNQASTTADLFKVGALINF